jgi:ferrochelatase
LNLQSNPAKTAILLLAHGSPDSVEDVPDFLLHVTGGRALPGEVVAEVTRRYSLIGRSPLTALTLKQGQLLARELGLPVYVGMRNWKPFITDTLRAMAADRIQRVVAICLAPQNSRTSVGLYRAAIAGDSVPFTIDFVESWHDHPLLIKAFSEKLLAGLLRANRELQAKVPVIFTAHSVPQRTILQGDPYESQARETAALVAREAALASEDWAFAFQSQGSSGGPWLGPGVDDTILDLKGKGHRGVFVQPIGFLCDHVEVLYDIDIGFKQFAGKQGMRLSRADSLNDSPRLTAALADLARSRLKK